MNCVTSSYRFYSSMTELFPAGYNPDVFVDQSAITDYICAICHMVVRKPHLTSCCGNLFCESCIDKVKKSNGPCPMCTDTKLATFHNKRVARILQIYRVVCPNSKESCQWAGELRHLEDHLLTCKEMSFPCEYSDYGCNKVLKNKDMEQHLKSASTIHLAMMKKAHDTLKEKYKSVLEEKKQIGDNLTKKELEHTELCGELERVKTELGFVQENEHDTWERQLATEGEKIFTNYKSVAPVVIKMANYVQNKQRSVQWFSCSFYTSEEGYKWCMRVDCNGYDKGKGTHVSVYFYLKRGEYDDKLQWPFRGRFVIQLQNQLRNAGHWEDILTFSSSVPEVYRSRVTNSERSDRGWGKHMYIPHGFVDFNPLTKSQYLRENTLYFKIFTAVNNGLQ